MKILFIVNTLANKAGTEQMVCALANLFSEKLGYSITVVNRLTKKKSDVPFFLSENTDLFCFSGNYFLFFMKLKNYLKKNHFDMVFVHNMGRLSLLCALLPRIKETYWVSLEHAFYGSYPKLTRLLFPLLAKRFNQIITLTEADKQNYLSFHNHVSKIDNISVYFEKVPNTHSYSVNSRHIIAVGRFSRQKNFKALLEAWKIVQQHQKEWYLDIYGDGEEKDILEKFITENKLSNVKLKRSINDLSLVYQQASFLVMTSKYEGLGLVLIEAQSFGLPLISFDCPHGPREVITHENNGFLVEDQHIEKLAEAILMLISDEQKRVQFSKQAKLASERYIPEKILAKWKKNVFNEVDNEWNEN
ncbi:glycosyltransferase family 4 protein [Mannheimia varigena]|uniref:glycosyltransferase family 4 protein n=1 Tax=Mannheimia varigena TaxID=85404 RepID=UPI0003E37E23|nr:glycosyltransferase family 4 protein [Mannheimia varigena]AHG76950.1 WefM [Mannheimia varigena USDA-ARS-USMARC-1312]